MHETAASGRSPAASPELDDQAIARIADAPADAFADLSWAQAQAMARELRTFRALRKAAPIRRAFDVIDGDLMWDACKSFEADVRMLRGALRALLDRVEDAVHDPSGWKQVLRARDVLAALDARDRELSKVVGTERSPAASDEDAHRELDEQTIARIAHGSATIQEARAMAREVMVLRRQLREAIACLPPMENRAAFTLLEVAKLAKYGWRNPATPDTFGALAAVRALREERDRLAAAGRSPLLDAAGEQALLERVRRAEVAGAERSKPGETWRTLAERQDRELARFRRCARAAHLALNAYGVPNGPLDERVTRLIQDVQAAAARPKVASGVLTAERRDDDRLLTLLDFVQRTEWPLHCGNNGGGAYWKELQRRVVQRIGELLAQGGRPLPAIDTDVSPLPLRRDERGRLGVDVRGMKFDAPPAPAP